MDRSSMHNMKHNIIVKEWALILANVILYEGNSISKLQIVIEKNRR